VAVRQLAQALVDAAAHGRVQTETWLLLVDAVGAD